jgi:prolyl oligopeptidase
MESDSNRDLMFLKIKDTAADLFLKDSMMVKFAAVFWETDESFLYTVEPDGRLGANRSQIRRHIIGQTQSNDKILFEAEKSLQNITLYRLNDSNESNRFLMIEEDSSEKISVTLSIFDAKFQSRTLVGQKIESAVSLIGIRDGKSYFTTFLDAPFGQILTVDLVTGERNTLFKSDKYAIDVALMNHSSIFMTQLDESVMHILSQFTFDSDKISDPKSIVLPFAANVEMSLDDKDNLKVSLQSYSRPATGWTLALGSEKLVKSTRAKPVQINLISRRVFYTAPNGKLAPIWLVYKKGVELNPLTPVLLYGYGGFGVNILPRYAVRESRISFFRRGGVMAFVTLPGGQEFGENWHQLGNLLNKRNVFDAFAAAGKQLIAYGFTSTPKLACNGGSNGGTLIGATINKYPELFKAAIPQVGVMDMTRFSVFTAGKFWVSEYGDSHKKADFYNLLSYSPLHNLKAQKYPATLVMTGSDDDRVVPMHSYKYAARLQELGLSDTPLLLHTDIGGSHGRSATEAEKVRKATNFATFLIQELQME